VTVSCKTANQYWANPPENNSNAPKMLKIAFLTIAPLIEILLFYQTTSSGYGALSILTRYPLTSKLLNGVQGSHRKCKNFWKKLGL